MSLTCTGIAVEGALAERCRELDRQAEQLGPSGPRRGWLAQAARSLSEVLNPWEVQIGPPPVERTYQLVLRSPALEVWIIHWPSGGRLQLHDHGGASGAFQVISGELFETYVDAAGLLAQRRVRAGQGLEFGSSYVHDVANTEQAGATSVHVYAPPSARMFFYRYDGPGRVVRVGEAPFESEEAS